MFQFRTMCGKSHLLQRSMGICVRVVAPGLESGPWVWTHPKPFFVPLSVGGVTATGRRGGASVSGKLA